MASGGRVLHHLKAYAPDRRNSIVLAGFLRSVRNMNGLIVWQRCAGQALDHFGPSRHSADNETVKRSWTGDGGRNVGSIYS